MIEGKFKKDFLKGSAAATIGTVSSMFFHFFSIMLLTRNIGKSDLGIYVLLLAMVNFFNILSSWGLNITLVKFISSVDKQQNKAALRAILNLRVVLLVILTVLFYFFSDLILPLFSLKKETFVFWIPLLFITASYKDLFFNVLQGLNEYKKYSIVQVISAAFRVVVIILFLYLNNLTLANLIYIEVFTSLVSVGVQLMIVPFRKLIDYKPTKETYKDIVKFSTPIHFNNILTFAYDRVSILFLGALLNPLSVAMYDIANKIPEALQRMFVSFMIVYFPNSSKLFSAGSKKDALYLMNKSINFFSVSIAILTFIAFTFSQTIVVLLFSSAYIKTAPAFAILMLNFYLRIMSNIKGYTIVSAGNSSVSVKVNIVSSIVNIGLAYVLIPKYGFMGAVYSVLVMNTIAQIIYHLYLIKLDLHTDGLNYLRPMFLLFIFAIVPFYLGVDSLIIKSVLSAAFLVCNWYFVEEFRNIIHKVSKQVKSFSNKIKYKISTAN
ncbi:MAG: oligosaccharide flippase family protein [Bacteroidota bacterium]|nr:oligosaccharide flippase family protein [Bacteroidota bacterium]